MEYSRPTFWMSGFTATIISKIMSVFRASLTPVILPPGASMLLTSLAVTGSDTAAKMMGMPFSVTTDCMTWAAGVAMGTTTSTPSSTSWAAIWFRVVLSPWPLKV